MSNTLIIVLVAKKCTDLRFATIKSFSMTMGFPKKPFPEKPFPEQQYEYIEPQQAATAQTYI